MEEGINETKGSSINTMNEEKRLYKKLVSYLDLGAVGKAARLLFNTKMPRATK